MRNKMLQLFLLLGLSIGFSGLAQAQIGSFYRANIPFDFTIGEKTFKAGEYSIKLGFVGNSPASFFISSIRGKGSAVYTNTLLENIIQPNKNALIVFDKNGDNYTLSKIKTWRTNIELIKSRKKQKSAKVSVVEVSMMKK